MPGSIRITVEINNNRLPDLSRALPGIFDQVQHDLIAKIEDNALNVVPIGLGPEHDERLSRNATLFQSHEITHPEEGAWELQNTAAHAGLVYFGNPLSPPRPWFEWALGMSWNWYRTRLDQAVAEIETIGGR